VLVALGQGKVSLESEKRILLTKKLFHLIVRSEEPTAGIFR
jgi:hypothetical protein